MDLRYLDKAPNRRCDLCTHYGMIDSGYGYCIESPPHIVYIKLIPLRRNYEYPIVAWCNLACGKFKPIEER